MPNFILEKKTMKWEKIRNEESRNNKNPTLLFNSKFLVAYTTKMFTYSAINGHQYKSTLELK
jgi:hypothetical protein